MIERCHGAFKHRENPELIFRVLRIKREQFDTTEHVQVKSGPRIFDISDYRALAFGRST